ncbi:hypothetical protein DOZ58_15945 [Acetobacterium sp. KB-1]|nr:hypothetical protein DOZ58_15945 [Acetobacterium sp. KB-1]
MGEKWKQIRRIIMKILLACGIVIIIIVQVTERNNLIEWREPITFTLRIYLVSVFIYIVFLNAIPLIWNYFKNKAVYCKIKM